MISEGWIALHRRFLGSDIWKDSPPQDVLVFIYLISIANHKDNPFGKIIIKRGQRLTNVPELVKGLNNWFTKDQIDKALDRLVKKGAITKVKSGSRKSLITVCNYVKWQSRTEIKTQPNITPNRKDDESSHSKGTEISHTIKRTEHIAEQNTKKAEAKNNNDLFNNNENNNTYTIQKRSLFLIFQKWVNDNCPSVANMKQTFTIDEYFNLKKRAGTKRLYSIVEDMENWEGLKNNSCAFKTFLTFFKKQGGESSKLSSIPKLPPEEAKEAAIEEMKNRKMVI